MLDSFFSSLEMTKMLKKLIFCQILVLLVLVDPTSAVSDPHWDGYFKVASTSRCDQNQCCCVTDRVTITRTSDLWLSIEGTNQGQCDESIKKYYLYMPTLSNRTTTLPLPLQATAVLSDDDNSVTIKDNIQVDCVNTLEREMPTPSWDGVYDVSSDLKCPTNICCCAIGTVTITKTSNTALQIQGENEGKCNEASKKYNVSMLLPFTRTAPLPAPFKATATLGYHSILIRDDDKPVDCQSRIEKRDESSSSRKIDFWIWNLLSAILIVFVWT